MILSYSAQLDLKNTVVSHFNEPVCLVTYRHGNNVNKLIFIPASDNIATSPAELSESAGTTGSRQFWKVITALFYQFFDHQILRENLPFLCSIEQGIEVRYRITLLVPFYLFCKYTTTYRKRRKNFWGCKQLNCNKTPGFPNFQQIAHLASLLKSRNLRFFEQKWNNIEQKLLTVL